MTLAATCDSPNSRVQLAGSAIPSLNGLPVYIDRQVGTGAWLGVRGASPAIPNAATLNVNDYEFSPNVVNNYRMRTDALYDTFTRTVASGWGTSDSGDPWTTSWSSGGAATDFAVAGGVGTLLQATASTSRLVVTALALDTDNYADIALTAAVTGTNGIEAGIIARYASGTSFYNALLEFTPSGNINLQLQKIVAGVNTGLGTVNNLFTTITVGHFYRLRFRVVGTSLFVKAWDPTVTPTEPGAWTLTASDTSLPGGTSVGAISFSESGNTNTTTKAQFDNFHTADLSSVNPTFTSLGTATATCAQTGAYLKFPLRPYLNEAVTLCNWSEETYPARGTVFQVLGRSLPIAVTELRSSRSFTALFVAVDAAAADALALAFSFGDIAFLQTPGANVYCGLARKSFPTQGYFFVGDVVFTRVADGRPEYLVSVPLTEVSAPDPSIPASSGTWQGIVNNFATWATLQAAFASWNAVLQYTPAPSTVIVG